MRENRNFVLGMMVVPMALLGLAVVYAGSVTTPNVFVADTPAVAANVNANFSAHQAAINDNDNRIATNTASVQVNDARITALGHAGPIYRFAVWSTYDQTGSWYANNDPNMFGGVSPSVWGDGFAIAAQMSADKDVLRTLFCRKGYGGKNAVVCVQQWKHYSSSNSRHAAALFRVRNTTNAPINWTVKCYQTAYATWAERASVALNGVDVWNSGGSDITTQTIQTHVLAIPASRTSTAIFIAASAAPIGETRACYLAFTDGTLVLPAGLEYVDDFDVASGDWTQ